jgi:hypothetical protein
MSEASFLRLDLEIIEEADTDELRASLPHLIAEIRYLRPIERAAKRIAPYATDCRTLCAMDGHDKATTCNVAALQRALGRSNENG